MPSRTLLPRFAASREEAAVTMKGLQCFSRDEEMRRGLGP